MDTITQKYFQCIRPLMKTELTSPLPPKRSRTDYTMANFSGPFVFQKTIGSPTSIQMCQTNTGLMCVNTAECGDIEDEKTHKQQDTKSILTPVIKLTIQQADYASTGSSKASVTAADIDFLLLEKNDQSMLTESDKFSSYLLDDAGETLAESDTSEVTDMSSHPVCKQVGESLDCKHTGAYNLPPITDKDGGEVIKIVTQIQTFTHSSSDEEVRFLMTSPRTHDDVIKKETGVCNTWSLPAAVILDCNQKRTENGSGENIFFSKETKEASSQISSSDYSDLQSFHSNPENNPSGDMTEYIKKENSSVCDVETKGQINDYGLSEKSIRASTEWTEGSIVSYEEVSARNIANDNLSLEATFLSGAKGQNAAGKMFAIAQRETDDYTTESPMPAGISQEPAEGDNDVGLLSVIDPTIWSKTDREAEEKCSNSEGTAGAKLYPSVKFCEMEMPLLLCSDRSPSQEVSTPDQTWQFDYQNKTQRCNDEKDDFCQSYTETKACPVTTNETHDRTVGNCLWKYCPNSRPKLPPAGNVQHHKHPRLGLEEQDKPGLFAVGLEQLEAEEIDILKNESVRMESTTEMNDTQEICFEETRNEEQQMSENSVDLEEKQNENHIEETPEKLSGDCISGGILDEMSIQPQQYNIHLIHYEEELRDNFKCSSDHTYSTDIPMKSITLVECLRSEEINGQGNSDILMKSEKGPQQRSPQNEDMTVSPDVCISERYNSCFSDNKHRADIFMVENKDDFLPFTFLATCDAIVPSPQELIPSQNADNNPRSLNCSDRFPPVPSAITFCDSVFGRFDTFEKIQLSLDTDDDNDDGGCTSNSPALTILPGQLSMLEAKSNGEEEVQAKVKKEVERVQNNTLNIANGFASSDYSCNNLMKCISPTDVTALRSLAQQPNNESAFNSFECVQDGISPQSISSSVSLKSDSPSSDVRDSPEFEMKKQYDVVVKELSLYFDISKSDFASNSRPSSPGQFSDVTETLKDSSSFNEQLSNPNLRQHGNAIPGDEDRSLDISGGEPLVSCTPRSVEGEQEVPQEEPLHTPWKHRGPPEQTRRLEPLRTCKRPIRIGLSKRAKTKQLHRPHLYK